MSTHTKHNEGLPWIEKYRPTSLDKIISHEYIVSSLHKYVQNKTLPNLILFGVPGTGKTSMIKSCANELFGNAMKIMTLEINASEERGVDIVRTRITQFANSHPTFSWEEPKCSNIKLIILDEADSMTFDAQLALKNVIDSYSDTTRFCLICNCIKKIHFSLISRCVKFRVQPLQTTQIFNHVKEICEKENVTITKDAIDEIIQYAHGDMRRVINVLQSIHTAYDNVNDKCVQKYLNQIPKNIIEIIMKSLLLDDVKTSHDKIYKIIHDNGYSFYELIDNINTKILLQLFDGTVFYENQNKIINQKQLLELIQHLGKIEQQIFSNININILLMSLISIFKSIQYES